MMTFTTLHILYLKLSFVYCEMYVLQINPERKTKMSTKYRVEPYNFGNDLNDQGRSTGGLLTAFRASDDRKPKGSTKRVVSDCRPIFQQIAVAYVINAIDTCGLNSAEFLRSKRIHKLLGNGATHNRLGSNYNLECKS